MHPLPRITSFPPSVEIIDSLNRELRDPDQILDWAVQQFTGSSNNCHYRLVQLSSFGPTGLVILDKLHRSGHLQHVPVVTIDTLHLFPESYALIQKLNQTYESSLELHVYKPSGCSTRKDFDRQHGDDLWQHDPDQYGFLTKFEPTQRALDELHVGAWITGRRRSQGGERTALPVIELEDTGRIKINPLAYWDDDDVWSYIHENAVSYNELHDKGYKSIGDVMTTKAVPKDAPERSGRFVGLNRTECGMHSHFLSELKRFQPDAMSEREEVVIPTVPCNGTTDDLFSRRETAHSESFVLPSDLCNGLTLIIRSVAKHIMPHGSSSSLMSFSYTNGQGFYALAAPAMFLMQDDATRLAFLAVLFGISILTTLRRRSS